MATPIVNRLLEEAQTLSDQDAAALLQIIEVMKRREKPPYDKAKDPAIGFFEGPEDLSERVEEIIEEETRKRGGWTLKDKA